LQLRRAKKQQQKRIEGDNKEVLAELSPVDVFERRLALEEFITAEDQERLKRLRQQFEKTVAEVEQELTRED
jgi:exonuclease SbcD